MLMVTVADLAIMARTRRAELKLGQADVAARAGVGRQWITKFEAGAPGVEIGLALATLRCLGVELHARFTWPPPDWTTPLTDAAGTRAHPYGRPRRAKRALVLSPQPPPPKKRDGLP